MIQREDHFNNRGLSYIASVKHDEGQEKLFKPEKYSKASGTSSNSFRHAPHCKIRPLYYLPAKVLNRLNTIFLQEEARI